MKFWCKVSHYFTLFYRTIYLGRVFRPHAKPTSTFYVAGGPARKKTSLEVPNTSGVSSSPVKMECKIDNSDAHGKSNPVHSITGTERKMKLLFKIAEDGEIVPGKSTILLKEGVGSGNINSNGFDSEIIVRRMCELTRAN